MTPAATSSGCPAEILRWANDHGYEPAEVIRPSPSGRVTARLTRAECPTLYAKWSGGDLLDEAERLSWLSGRFASPPMVDYLATDAGSLVVTAALPGSPAVDGRWASRGEEVASALGEGLARLHSLPASDCIFDAPAWLNDDVGDEIAVLHGDPQVKNLLLDSGGSFAGFVHVGYLGPGDVWADLAVATASLVEHFGPVLVPFWAAYGRAPDEDLLAHYLAQWAPGPGLG